MTQSRVAVAGGSLGGLTAALWLRDAGCAVEVFERSDAELTDRGAGLLLHRASARYFVEHGIARLDQLGTHSRLLRFVDREGAVIHEEAREYYWTSWNSLYRSLLGCFGQRDYHLGHRLCAFEQDADGVSARFANGHETRCDLLVCADGVGSTAREILLPGVSPRYAGYVGWRGTVGEAELSPAAFEALREAITYHVMPDSHILAYPIPGVDGAREAGRRLINFVWYRNVAEGAGLDDLMTDVSGALRPVSLPPGAVRARYVAALRAAGARLPAVFAEIVAITAEPFVQKIFDMETPRTAFGRVCLIGDAAFAARPHAAAGAAKAADDAWSLGEAVRAADGDVAGALERWEPGRLDLGARLVARTRASGDRSQFEGTFRPGDPALAFGLYGPGD